MTLQHRLSTVFPPITGLAAAILIAGCGGGGGGGGGGLSVNEKAAAAAFGGAFIALNARDITGQAEGDEEGDGVFEAASAVIKSARNVAKDAQPCSGGGTLSEEVGTAVSLYAGPIATERIVAVDCVESFPEANFSSRVNGIIESGEAENGAVFFFKASGASGDPDDDSGRYSSVTNVPGFDSDIELRGLMNICDGCAAPQDDGNIEQEVFLSARLQFSGTDLSFEYGRSSEDPLRFVGTTSGATATGRIDGLLSVNAAGTPCSFSADYETVQDLQFEGFNSDNERITGGELNIAVDGGSPIAVVFQADGGVIVNGQTFTEADLEALEDECDLELGE